jgi:[lysine-biosynthesis-protein LysW]--L-2-aminoadipate ligase
VVNRETSFGILASRIGVEEKSVLSALERRGLDVATLDTRRLVVAPDSGAPRSRLILNREIGFYRALYAAEALEAVGTTVVNNARTTAICGDKWRMTVRLREHGLPVPRTALALTPEAALTALEEIGYPAVFKPLVGSWGRLVSPVPDPSVAATILEHIAALPAPASRIVYVQEMVPKLDRDIRVVVVGGEVLGATYRRGAEWRTNVARGAVSEYWAPTPEITKLAEAAAEATGAEIAGVDLVEDGDGNVYVLEVNHRVEFAGFQRAQGDRVDVADRIAAHLLRRAAA